MPSPKKKHIQKAKEFYLLFFCKHAYLSNKKRDQRKQKCNGCNLKKHHQHDKVKEKAEVPGKGYTGCRKSHSLLSSNHRIIKCIPMNHRMAWKGPQRSSSCNPLAISTPSSDKMDSACYLKVPLYEKRITLLPQFLLFTRAHCHCPALAWRSPCPGRSPESSVTPEVLESLGKAQTMGSKCFQAQHLIPDSFQCA